MATPTPPIGVVIVTYMAEAFIAECLESLTASRYPNLRIVVVDNASPDGTASAVRAWADGSAPFEPGPDWPLRSRNATEKPRTFAERQELWPILGDGRSGGGVLIGFAHLDAVGEFDASDNLRQLVAALQLAPGSLGRGDQLEYHDHGRAVRQASVDSRVKCNGVKRSGFGRPCQAL